MNGPKGHTNISRVSKFTMIHFKMKPLFLKEGTKCGSSGSS